MATEFEDSRRDFLVRALGAGAFTAVGSSGLVAPAYGMGKIPKELVPGKSIYEMRGDVRVDGQRASMSTKISASSLVETGSSSYVVFVVGTDAHVLRENSKVKFSGSGVVEEGLRILTGKILSVFGTRPAGQKHTLRTTTATIGIRGTGVYAESEEDVSYLCTCYGVVDIMANNDASSKERITATHHDAPRYILADGTVGSLLEPAPVKNHTDEELMLIESLVGRVPPFSSIGGYSSPRRGY